LRILACRKRVWGERGSNLNMAFPDEATAADVTSALTGDKIRSVLRLTTGNQNFVYAVVSDNSEYVIRMTLPQFREKFLHAQSLQDILIPLGVPLAAFIANDIQGQYSAFPSLLMRRLPGADLGAVYHGLSNDQKKSLAKRMVEIHRLTNSLPDGKAFGYTSNPIHPSWDHFIENELNIACERIRKAEVFSEMIPEGAVRLFGQIRGILQQVSPRPFLPDTTVKNVMVHNGEFVGIVDVDEICYGDSLFVLTLTYAGSEIDGHDLQYADYWRETLQLTADAEQRLEFYRLLHTLWFMGEYSLSSTNGRVMTFDRNLLDTMCHDAFQRLRAFGLL
jgi:aminoglycoside phosphotransferase (APT) family kinase protein